MKKLSVALFLLVAAPALAALRCEQVVAGMGANEIQTSREDMGTLLLGASEQSLPVRVYYRTWTRSSVAVEGFVLGEHRGWFAPRVFRLQLDDRQVTVSLEAIARIEVLWAPPNPELSREQRRALDHLREAWERRRPVRLYRAIPNRGLLARVTGDAPDRVTIRAVRVCVTGGYAIDYERTDAGGKGTWRFEDVIPHTVRWD